MIFINIPVSLHLASRVVSLIQYLIFLGDRADLIFVFFDPIGQALCKRTLNIVGRSILTLSSCYRRYTYSVFSLFTWKELLKWITGFL